MKRGLVAGVAAAAAMTARRYLANRDAMADVADELRSPLLWMLSPPTSRRMLPITRFNARLRTPSGGGVTVAEHRSSAPAVRMLVTTPSTSDQRRAAVLWIHSGGFVVGSPQFEAFVTGQIAREIGAVVVAPAYRLAPEHPFPAALDDCMAALSWVGANADAIGVDANRIAVAGASAGGGLAASVAQRCHDEGIPLAAQALVYPMLDDRTALVRDHGRRGQFMWTPGSTRFGWSSYLGCQPGTSGVPEDAVPARRPNLSGLAPAWIGVGDLDLLHDESAIYAERLREAGVLCELIVVPGMYHAADGIARNAPSMKRFRASMLEHLRTHLLAEA
ncbi:alpha/beta hydrolase [Mycolicibacterium gadium]|uniref:Alpha/beta hydrolase n=1 Tax=Mycolicibacterium gadium TaxID=1794 RepID=A0ABT6GYF3_MYCGU|nr:alpha/beta hydrolase [Mycolicibacterium gadium]MDG5486283.1 alpha/beta hydrolase [Mycolicibacterium gadium]